MKSGFVVSDLHLYSRRSYGGELLALLRDKVQQCDCVVLNGDTFDFGWTALPTVDETAGVASRMLADLAAINPACTVHYVMGNHDHARPFLRLVQGLASDLRNFRYHQNILRLDDKLFLHGDVCNRLMDQAGLEASRAVYLDMPLRSNLRKNLYELVIAAGLNKVAYIEHPARLMCSRIMHYLKTSHADMLDGAAVIYFGHTHCPLRGAQYFERTFYNTGSTIRGLSHAFLPFDYQGALLETR